MTAESSKTKEMRLWATTTEVARPYDAESTRISTSEAENSTPEVGAGKEVTQDMMRDSSGSRAIFTRMV